MRGRASKIKEKKRVITYLPSNAPSRHPSGRRADGRGAAGEVEEGAGEAEGAAREGIGWMGEAPKWAIVGMTLGIFCVVALVDYLTGYEISCTVFYLLAIGMGTWRIGARYGISLCAASAVCTTVANVLTGERYTNHFAPYWDAAIVFCFYFIVVWLLRSLRMNQDQLEERVRERTANLTAELAERKRLEREILVISEREQSRIGRDIHDSLCQHLTGTALAEQYLVEKLASRYAPEAEDAERVVDLLEEGIRMARGLATGLAPIEMEGDGLAAALADLAAHFSTQYKVECEMGREAPIFIHDGAVTMHLYRITQEAVHNAIRHGKAARIVIRLEKEGTLVRLTIADNGGGVAGGGVTREGMGLRNMKYRASMIGGRLTIGPGDPGTIVSCCFHEGAGLPN